MDCMTPDTGDLSPVISPLLATASQTGIRHGFFTRQGGVSEGIYAGLNVGVGSHDDRDHVMENRRRVAAWFGKPLEKLATLHQCHSADVLLIDETYAGERPKADALVSKTPGMVLGVLAADCGPVLFADPKARIIGAAHAGWKGAFDGVLEATIDAMVALGADRSSIIACLGPSISHRHYEVGPEFVERFTTRQADYARFFAPSVKPGHSMFDLPRFTLERLKNAGVTAENLDLCTYPDEDRFFSYRRTTHRGEPDYGRQISAIQITE
jgi:YfiH family protein